jgi:hypothetical protein
VLVLDFPIVGEKKMALSLDPRVTAKHVNQSQLVRLIERQMDERSDKENIIEGVQEFLVLTSEFVQFKAQKKIPTLYNFSEKDGHYFLKREHGDHLYEIDAFVLNEKFFERVVIKIYSKLNVQNGPILTLFLIPETCEK